MYWFRAGLDKSYPNIIYTNGNRSDECDVRFETQRSCVHHFSKNISAIDDGTYYCAVAMCGEILFGNGTKLDLQGIIVLDLEILSILVTDYTVSQIPKEQLFFK